MIMFTNMVSGYLDPSVMTYAIQAIAGVVIAISTWFCSYIQEELCKRFW